MHYLTRRVAFESSHYYRIPQLNQEENQKIFGASANLNGHGHNYILEATIKGNVNPENGMVVNIKKLDRLLRDFVLLRYDHKQINTQHPIFSENPKLQPTNENIAIEIWNSIEEKIEGATLHQVKLREDPSISAKYKGDNEVVSLTKIYHFSASHRLHELTLNDAENMELFGKCSNPNGHGHNYVLEVTVKGKIDRKTGMVFQLETLDRIVESEVQDRFDHKHLNLDTKEFESLNPTSENFVQVLWQLLEPKIGSSRAKLRRLRLWETPKSYFDYYGK